MLNANTLHTFARVRSLALAAMIEAGGNPCWVASAAPAAKKTPPSASCLLTADERARYPGISDRLAASMNRVFRHFDEVAQAGIAE